jgi:hypothetical protein
VCADYLACAVNGSLVYVDWVGGHLKYHVVSPACFYALYHETILDNGEPRAVDYSEIEDATAIILQLSGPLLHNPREKQFLAIFGRSEEYPWGRHVTYRATRWDAIPQVDKGGVEYKIDNKIANPMSWVAAQMPDSSMPEYPIAAIDGGLAKTQDGILSPTTSLYENCLEIDAGYSRLLKDALNAARGKDIIKNESGQPLPRSLEGTVSLLDGQTYEDAGRDAAHAEKAQLVLEGIVATVGSGYSVPDYHLVSSSAALESESGVALMIKTRPLMEFRDYRIQVNRPSVDKIFEIERSKLLAHDPETGAKLTDVHQAWDPGRLTIPEDRAAKVGRLTAAQTAGYIDVVRAVREYHNLATDEDAKRMLELFAERAAEFPGPAPPRRAAPPVGITRPGG